MSNTNISIKQLVIIDSSSLDTDLDFRVDYEALKSVISKITEVEVDNLDLVIFDNQDSAKHTFHFSVQKKGYSLILKDEDGGFVEPQYIHCHCCESLVLDPATNKNVFDRDLGAVITNYVYSNLENYSKVSLLSSNNNLSYLVQSLATKGLLGKVILTNKNKKRIKMLPELKEYYIDLNSFYTELGGFESKVQIKSTINVSQEEQKVANTSAMSKFGKKVNQGNRRS